MTCESCLREMDGDKRLGVVGLVDQKNLLKSPLIGFSVSMNLVKWSGKIYACAYIYFFMDKGSMH